MGFTVRRRTWVVVALIIWAYCLQDAFDYGRAEDWVSGIIGAYVICWILNKVVVGNWILRGIKTEKDMQVALKYNWVRKKLGYE